MHLDFMRRALELAARGRGFVEPNPMVGCVIAQESEVVGEGWHQRFGGPHAEIEAIRSAGERARNADMYVTLEPCCHFGKTPPCTDAILEAGIRRVFIGMRDPFPAVSGGGIQQLQNAGIEVSIGCLENEAQHLNAPYLKLITEHRPWVIAKWAMSLDGKIATRSGDSRWISNEKSRQLVHEIRGRVDAIIVGRGTALRDDPALTARPPGPRLATRIVLDSRATLPTSSQLYATAKQVPVLVAASQEAPAEKIQQLQDAGCEVVVLNGSTWPERLPQLLTELGRRRMTNVLLEGGAETLAGFLEAGYIDEVHVFIAAKIIGGQSAPSAIAGLGVARITEAIQLHDVSFEQLNEDLHVWGRRRGENG